MFLLTRALDRGAVPYTPPTVDDDDDDDAPLANILKFNPYERQVAPPPLPTAAISSSGSGGQMDINALSSMLNASQPSVGGSTQGNQVHLIANKLNVFLADEILFLGYRS